MPAAAQIKLDRLQRRTPLPQRQHQRAILAQRVPLGRLGRVVEVEELLRVDGEGQGQVAEQGGLGRAEAVEEVAEKDVDLRLVRCVAWQGEFVLGVEEGAGFEVGLAAGKEDGEEGCG
jgi:hypothetical protein